MLSPDEIVKRLESQYDTKTWVAVREKAMRGLPRVVKQVGQKLVDLAKDPEPGKTTDVWRTQNTAKHFLVRYDDKVLLQLGDALFPKLAKAFRAAWKLHDRLPYLSGPTRKPFRAPGREDLLKEARVEFLVYLLHSLESLDLDLPQLAAYAPHLEFAYNGSQIGLLLAAGIDAGGPQADEIKQILRDSAEGQHEIGQMGRHVITAFLCSSDRECWEYIEKLLLAAQRQEGLRQQILEAVDFAHPGAFRHMLRVILDNNLVRFSATVRAADVWLGFLLDAQSARYSSDTLEKVAGMLDDEAVQTKALAGNDGAEAFLSLWCLAFEDAQSAIPAAAKLLEHRSVEMRYAAVAALTALGIPDTYDVVVPAVDDTDERVACLAANAASSELHRRIREQEINNTLIESFESALPNWLKVNFSGLSKSSVEAGDLFERLERLLKRFPKPTVRVKPLVWPWSSDALERQSVADALLLALADRPLDRIVPYFQFMSPEGRCYAAELLQRPGAMKGEFREVLLRMVGDASTSVREAAISALTKQTLKPDDASILEELLTRKSEDLRRAVIKLLLTLSNDDALASACRLIWAKQKPQRMAGLDLMQQMIKDQRATDATRRVARTALKDSSVLDSDERAIIEKLVLTAAAPQTLANALGLMDPAKRTPPTPPQKRAVQLVTPAAAALAKLIDDTVHEHRDTPVELYEGATVDKPLGSFDMGLGDGSAWHSASEQYMPRKPEDIPLWEIWKKVWADRPKAARDADGMEVVRAILVSHFESERRWIARKGLWAETVRQVIRTGTKLKYPAVVLSVLQWLVTFESNVDIADFIVDAFETILSAIPRERVAETDEFGKPEFRFLASDCDILTVKLRRVATYKKHWQVQHGRRLFGLLRWVDEPLSVALPSPTGIARLKQSARSLAARLTGNQASTHIPRQRVNWDDMAAAFDGGYANENDVFDSLLGPREKENFYQTLSFREFSRASLALRKHKLSPALAAVVQRAIDRVLDIELERGDSETPATQPATHLEYAGGVDVLVRVLQAIGRDSKLRRTRAWGDAGLSKSASFSHLITVTSPGKDDTPQRFAEAMNAASIGEEMLLAAGMFAPHWARHVQEAVKWESLNEAIWWIHAHTKDNKWRVDEEIRSAWNAEIRKLTPLTLEDLVDGAVDVEWFSRVYQSLGSARWNKLDELAKYATGGAGHKRAQLFADAMLGQVKRETLIKDIESKRKQDAVRALGLLPLAHSSKEEVLARYRVMQEFVRGCRKFGSQRQASEKLATRIGMDNLARTAGYPDATRLQWAMEGLATADLAKGPVTAQVGDVVVQLAISDDGLPEISSRRGDKPLKSIPPAVKKSPAVQELIERKTDLRRSASRMRQALELSMCRGDRFTGGELRDLMGNVMLRPLMERLIFIGDGLIGYPVDGGQGLRDCAGKIEPIRKNDALQMAHPVDLLATKQWSQWQRDCFAVERVQPFKQIFRELYVLTEQERKDGTFSARYAGHQVNPRQAVALLGSRGWVVAPEAGVFRLFHEDKIVAWIEFMEAFHTPADIEGLTMERVRFARRSEYEPLRLEALPPRLLSETFRDVDLMVSVAHRGGVDPEASAGTVDMRRSLLRETLTLLQLDNVTLKETFAVIRGELGEYTVHLGSATTHLIPGGELVIVPVHGQHRGRLFLPFADDDPKTAEVMSKVLLLSRDREIKDVNLLAQIRARE